MRNAALKTNTDRQCISFQECQNHEDMDVDMDRDFLLDLREFKVLMEREYAEEHRRFENLLYDITFTKS